MDLSIAPPDSMRKIIIIFNSSHGELFFRTTYLLTYLLIYLATFFLVKSLKSMLKIDYTVKKNTVKKLQVKRLCGKKLLEY